MSKVSYIDKDGNKVTSRIEVDNGDVVVLENGSVYNSHEFRYMIIASDESTDTITDNGSDLPSIDGDNPDIDLDMYTDGIPVLKTADVNTNNNEEVAIESTQQPIFFDMKGGQPVQKSQDDAVKIMLSKAKKSVQCVSVSFEVEIPSPSSINVIYENFDIDRSELILEVANSCLQHFTKERILKALQDDLRNIYCEGSLEQ